ncbi:P2 family phage major capsid protein [Aeromonas molluscorum]|uniref:P2 family phage major capsid protein n=1 Tax=Aeromonas molluscorum TaxID=271417 RepID=UPI003F1AA5D6
MAGTTDTTKEDRQAVDPTDLTGNRYRCEQTNFDTALRYAKIDAWAKFKDFQTRIRDAILQRQALDHTTNRVLRRHPCRQIQQGEQPPAARRQQGLAAEDP